MQNDWLLYAILALIMWGLWGFFPKLATNYLNPKTVLIFQTFGSFLISLLIFFSLGFKLEMNTLGIFYAFLAGIAGTMGSLFFLYAISKGKASVIVPFTSLYPLVTLFLAFLFLKESVSPKQLIGIIFALIGIILLAE